MAYLIVDDGHLEADEYDSNYYFYDERSPEQIRRAQRLGYIPSDFADAAVATSAGTRRGNFWARIGRTIWHSVHTTLL